MILAFIAWTSFGIWFLNWAEEKAYNKGYSDAWHFGTRYGGITQQSAPLPLPRPQIGDDVSVYEKGAQGRPTGTDSGWPAYAIHRYHDEPNRLLGSGTLVADGMVHVKRPDDNSERPYTLMLKENHIIR